MSETLISYLIIISWFVIFYLLVKDTIRTLISLGMMIVLIIPNTFIILNSFYDARGRSVGPEGIGGLFFAGVWIPVGAILLYICIHAFSKKRNVGLLIGSIVQAIILSLFSYFG